MNVKDFKAGIYKQRYQYKSFEPEMINHTWVWNEPRLNVLLEKAIKSLTELNAYSILIPDIDLFISMHIIKEANASSKIEGTKTEMDEILMRKEDISPDKRDDWQEVHNYIDAMNYALDELNNKPLSNRLLKEAHNTLLEGVRGEHKTPGEFRRSQNWIGGTSLSDALFIPPHNDSIPELMSDLEKFLHNEEIEVPHLIKVAIAHYQFETIHPFLDGNGRIGRLLITLYLVANKLLNKPTLYLSDYLEKNRAEYYDSLTKVRVSNDLTQWLLFFLNSVVITAEKGKETFKRIINLKEEMNNQIFAFGTKAEKVKFLINRLYKDPIINASAISEYLSITQRAARDIIDKLIKNKILYELTGQKRNRVFLFKKYWDSF